LDGRTQLESPSVQLRSDGLHFVVNGDQDQTGFTIENASGFRVTIEMPPGTQYPEAGVTAVPPGTATVRCGGSKDPDPVGLEITDPGGLFHDGWLSCRQDEASFEEFGPFTFFSESNPLPEALGRAVPGILVSDEISYAGFPEGEFASGGYRVVRDGQVLGSIEVAPYGPRSFVTGWACKDSLIGSLNRPSLGLLGTPFELTDSSSCDPYMKACEPIYFTAASYAALRGESTDAYAYPDEPWNLCSDDQPSGCPSDPEKIVLPILLSPELADPFRAENGCGATEDTAC
jgi:hypothetical protein